MLRQEEVQRIAEEIIAKMHRRANNRQTEESENPEDMDALHR